MRLDDLGAPLEATFRSLRAVVLRAWSAPRAPLRYKDDRSAITALDHALEERLVPALLALEPSFGVVSEEAGEVRPGTPTWYLDPLDGSANFARRIAVFGSQVVLMEGDRPLVSAIYEPLADDFAWAVRGRGAWREGRRIRVSERALDEAVVLFDHADSGRFAQEPALLGAIRARCYKMRAFGTIAIHMREVAAGAADAFVGSRGAPTPIHDLGPGALLVREAGGHVTDGRGTDAMKERRAVVAGGRPAHDALAALLAGA